MQLKGQLFSMDFVIAMAILTIAIGVTLQTVDNFQKRVQFIERTHTNNADVIAELFVQNSTSAGSNAPGFINATPYCYLFSNGTGNCGSLNCPGNTFSAIRLVGCYNSALGPGLQPCSIQVRTCK